MRQILLVVLILSFVATLAAETMSSLEFELRILDLVNQRRTENGLKPLAHDPGLSKLARSHSRNMGMGGFFDHVDKEGLQVLKRQQKYYPELIHAGIGENLYLFESGGRKFDPEAIVRGWMKSEGHRSNILHGEYTHSGVGVFLMGEKLYTTQVFAISVLKLVSELPEKFQKGKSYTLDFEYLADEEPQELQCLLATPDPKQLVKVTPFVYYEGTAPVEPVWKDDSHLSLPLAFNYGKGTYSLRLGWDDEFYEDMMVFRVK